MATRRFNVQHKKLSMIFSKTCPCASSKTAMEVDWFAHPVIRARPAAFPRLHLLLFS